MSALIYLKHSNQVLEIETNFPFPELEEFLSAKLLKATTIENKEIIIPVENIEYIKES